MDLTTLPLVTLAEMANEAAEACRDSARRTVQQAASCGRALLAAKEQCEHGQWLHWLGQNFDYDKATAQRYMQVAKPQACGIWRTMTALPVCCECWQTSERQSARLRGRCRNQNQSRNQ